MKEKIKKVVLAYSGGLDTSVILKWLIRLYQCEVVTFSADIGQEDNFEQMAKSQDQHIQDLHRRLKVFLRDYVFSGLPCD